MTIAPHRISVNLPENWTAEYDDHGHITHWMGPALDLPGLDLYTAADHHVGPQAYDADGTPVTRQELRAGAAHILAGIKTGDYPREAGIRAAVGLLRLDNALGDAERAWTN